MLSRARLKSKGFTLVELIIVVLIIGILATISIVVYVNQTKKARANSAYYALTDAVRAASACVANGDTLTAFGPVPIPMAPNWLRAGVAICIGAGGNPPASTGVWPDISKITNDGMRYSADSVESTGAIDITITGRVGTDQEGHSITCTATGCTKTGF